LFWDSYYFLGVILFIFLAILFWHRKYLGKVILWIACLFFGLWRFSISLPIDSLNNIWHYNGQKIEFIGMVAYDPLDKIKSQQIVVKTSLNTPRPRLSGGTPLFRGDFTSGLVLLNLPIYPEYSYGDILKIKCKLEEPGIIEDFDYGKYLAGKNIYSTCAFPQLEVLSARNIFPGEIIFKEIYRLKNKLRGTIESGLVEPEAGFLKAFILGDSSAIPDNLNQTFRQSGLSHIVAISGTHITILVAMVFSILLGINLKRRVAFYFAIPIIIFYIFLAGSPASAVRSGVMGFLVLLAFHIGRLNRLDYSLVLAGVVMLLFNPKLLIADGGFQLSFLAVLGMIYLYPVFDKWSAKFYKGRPAIIKVISQMISLTIAAQIFTAPILIFSFHQISLVAPLANIFVLWTSPFIMGGAFIAIILSLIFPPGAQLFFLPVGLLLKYMILVAELATKIPGAFLKW